MWGVTFLFITDGLCRKGEGMEEEMFCRHITKDLVHTPPPDNRTLRSELDSPSFKLHHDYSNSLSLSNIGERSRSRPPKNHIQVQTDKRKF